MSILEYIKDKLLLISIYLLNSLFILILLSTFKVNVMLFSFIMVSLLVSGLAILCIDYRQQTRLMNALHKQMAMIEKKYLVHEMLDDPHTYFDKQFFSYIQEINTCMINDINAYKLTLDDFKQYLEMWVHEIKIPLASARLMVENNKDKVDVQFVEELNRIENLVEQVLYYVRSGYVENDYLIKQASLQTIVNAVLVEQRNQFIQNKIAIQLRDLEVEVYTDTKWMEFIVRQILSNSIKYRGDNPSVSIYSIQEDNQVILCVEDNGLGISAYDLPRIFDKGFTGENGRMRYKSTGIGLYLCKSLCEKMHHSIVVMSTPNVKTTVSITFPKSKMIDIRK